MYVQLQFALLGFVQNWANRTFSTIQALSDLFKSITSLPSDITLISLPAGPLLELICVAAQKQLTATWLSLSAILIAQLNPPSYSLYMRTTPLKDAELVVANVLPVLLQCGLNALAVPGAMEAVSSSSSVQPKQGLIVAIRTPILFKSSSAVWIG